MSKIVFTVSTDMKQPLDPSFDSFRVKTVFRTFKGARQWVIGRITELKGTDLSETDAQEANLPFGCQMNFFFNAPDGRAWHYRAIIQRMVVNG